jgi:hypothetical protein
VLTSRCASRLEAFHRARKRRRVEGVRIFYTTTGRWKA